MHLGRTASWQNSARASRHSRSGEASLRSNECGCAMPGHRQGVPDAIPPGDAVKYPSAERASNDGELEVLWILKAVTGMELWPGLTARAGHTGIRQRGPASGIGLLCRPARAPEAESRQREPTVLRGGLRNQDSAFGAATM